MEARSRGERGAPESRTEKGRRAEDRITGTCGVQGGTGKGGQVNGRRGAPGWREWGKDKRRARGKGCE